MKLHLLQYVVRHTAASQSEFADQYRQMEKTVSAENLAQMPDEYRQFLLSDVENTQESLSASEQERENENRRIVAGMLVLYLAIILYCAISVALNYTSRDALTHLNSRKQYEEIRLMCEKKKIPYCFFMIDIDDFKKVNDTYGHDKGDKVLCKTGEILLGYTGRGIYAYRYGGEETCLFFLRVPAKRARQIAEEIRVKISQTICVEDRCITISGGIGVSDNGENVFQDADRQLYESKRNGKTSLRTGFSVARSTTPPFQPRPASHGSRPRRCEPNILSVSTRQKKIRRTWFVWLLLVHGLFSSAERPIFL